MKGALIILAVTVAAGIVLYVFHRIGEARERRNPSRQLAAGDEDAPAQQAESECCGMHITCEKDSLLRGVSTEIVYYDDEELDEYAGISPDAYTEAQIEQFRDVLLTLLPDDIAGWARSLQLRGIELPGIVKEELLLLVREEREKRANN